MADTSPEIDLDSVIDRLLEGKSLSRPGLGPRWRLLCAFNNHQASASLNLCQTASTVFAAGGREKEG